MAHNGVLFLDELPEFKRSALEVMRQPLEDREVTISRARFTVTYPCSFMLVASMNPSPSGYFNDPDAPMTTSPADIQRYLGKTSKLEKMKLLSNFNRYKSLIYQKIIPHPHII